MTHIPSGSWTPWETESAHAALIEIKIATNVRTWHFYKLLCRHVRSGGS